MSRSIQGKQVQCLLQSRKRHTITLRENAIIFVALTSNNLMLECVHLRTKWPTNSKKRKKKGKRNTQVRAAASAHGIKGLCCSYGESDGGERNRSAISMALQRLSLLQFDMKNFPGIAKHSFTQTGGKVE